MEGQPVQQDPPPNGLPLEGHVPRQQQLPATQDDAAHPLLRRAVVADVPRLERCQGPGRGFQHRAAQKDTLGGVRFFFGKSSDVAGWEVIFGRKIRKFIGHFSSQNP